MPRVHIERHLVKRIGWLRAAVLGANDGIISTASLILGVAAAAAAKSDIMLAGVAGLVAGAMSMAAGEYVSVSSQSDTEQAISQKNGESSRKIRNLRKRNSRRFMLLVAWRSHWRARSRNSLRPKMR
jgi:VIT1/CCC1 family predicted Fe2+/Mn2+ transporter